MGDTDTMLKHVRHVLAAVGLAATMVVGSVVVESGRAAPTADAACAINSNLGLGSRGSSVQCVQSTLNALGYNSGPVDGAFGGVTFGAVVRFQQAKGLYVDGIVGRQTGTALGIWGSPSAGAATPVTPAPAASAPAPSTAASTNTSGCGVSAWLRIGSRGDAVRCVQIRLYGLGYSVGPVDGIFGTQTYGGVVRYQRAKGLYVDGVVGRQTATSLGIWGTAPAPAASSTPAATASGACTPPAGLPAAARQVVVVTSSGSWADIDLLVYSGGRWTCARSDMIGRVGRNGVRTLVNRRSGDDTTPGGVFPLGTMTAPDGQTFQFFGNGSNPGVPGTWRQVKAGDCWGATPGQSSYNALVSRAAAACTGDDEYLPNYINSYSQAAIIGANMGPDRSGDAPGETPYAAAIFLHRTTYDSAGNSRPTAGCVSLNANDLAAVLRVLKPGEAYFVIR
ncbi:hypothetical protein BH24ACT5_BH24ACT5_20330 [soil metagenome]